MGGVQGCREEGTNSWTGRGRRILHGALLENGGSNCGNRRWIATGRNHSKSGSTSTMGPGGDGQRREEPLQLES